MREHVLCLVVPLLLLGACRGPGLGSPESGQLAKALHASEVALRIQPNDRMLLLQRAQILAAAGACTRLRTTLATLQAVAHGGLTAEH